MSRRPQTVGFLGVNDDVEHSLGDFAHRDLAAPASGAASVRGTAPPGGAKYFHHLGGKKCSRRIWLRSAAPRQVLPTRARSGTLLVRSGGRGLFAQSGDVACSARPVTTVAHRPANQDGSHLP